MPFLRDKPSETVSNWGNQMDWHYNRLTSSMPYSSSSIKSYGYPVIPQDIQNYLVKDQKKAYWSLFSIARSGGQVQTHVGNKVLSFSTK